jgi:hypothetical protein
MVKDSMPACFSECPMPRPPKPLPMMTTLGLAARALAGFVALLIRFSSDRDESDL